MVGDNVKLECYTNVSLPRLLDVEWFKSVDGNNTRVNLTADVTKYSGGTLSKHSLTIYRTNFDDTAGYSCRTNNTAFEVNQEFHHVAVEGGKTKIVRPIYFSLIKMGYIMQMLALYIY